MATALSRRLGSLAADIKIAHAVFALPFALLATFLAADGWPGWAKLLLVVACMFFARTYAMLANRYLDRSHDARNPRTAARALPAGRVGPAEVRAAILFCAFMLIAGAASFSVFWDNWWPLAGAPLVLLWLGAYALLKQWTSLCHFFLGGALGLSPLAAGLAIAPASLGNGALWWLAGFVVLWVGGFDVIYALQDLDVDRREGLHSVPARLGSTGALWVSRTVHAAAMGMLIAAWESSDLLGTAFAAAICLVAAMLVLEHCAAALGRFSMAFFTFNGGISLLLGAAGIADVLAG